MVHFALQMDFQDYLKTTARDIDEELGCFLHTWKQEASKLSKKFDPLNGAFVEGFDGGKRVRGVLVRLGFELTGNEYIKEILRAAAAIEVFQTSILAHDDIIDCSPTRRGRPSLYNRLGGDHYGKSQTICLGDAGFFLAARLIAASNFPTEKKNQALSFFIDMMINTVLGEMLDVEISRKIDSILEEEVINVFKLKTALYSIIGPLTLGAILGGGNKKLLGEIDQLGESLGIAYQIQDDILGVFGLEETIGKSATSDIEEGKGTLLIMQALKNATPDQKNFLQSRYGNGSISKEDHEEIKRIFTVTGALDYSRSLGLKYVVQAKKIIQDMELDSKYKQLLTELADFLVNRER